MNDHEKAQRIVEELLSFSEDKLRALTEFSISRMYRHYLEGGHTSWAVMTAWQKNKSRGENKRNNASLEQDFSGHGYVKLLGHGMENDEVTGQEIAVTEPSYGVFDVPLDRIKNLQQKYEQDSVIYAGPETEGHVFLIYKSGSTQDLGEFHPSEIGKYFSSWRGRPFTYEMKIVDVKDALAEMAFRRSIGLPPRTPFRTVLRPRHKGETFDEWVRNATVEKT